MKSDSVGPNLDEGSHPPEVAHAVPSSVVGAGSYVGDLIGEDALHAKFVRSDVAHGMIVDVDMSAAGKLEGVADILLASDLNLSPMSQGELDLPGMMHFAREPLARDVVRFAGEPIALVLAETERQAVDAVSHIWVEIEELPAVVGVQEAIESTTSLFLKAGSNVVVDERRVYGHLDDEAEVSVTVEVENQRVAASPMEPPAIVATPLADGRIEIVCGHQAPHELRTQLVELLGLPEEKLVVKVPDVGGAFGLKGVMLAEYAVVVASCVRVGRPIAWLASRRESFLSGPHGRGQLDRLTLRGDREGRISGCRAELLADLGAYPQHGVGLPFNTRLVLAGPYDFQGLDVTIKAVVTNTAPIAPYRGAGRPEAAMVLERAIDAFASEIEMDPADVRRLNLVESEQMPYTSPVGAVYDSGDYGGALSLALDEIQYSAVRTEQAERLRHHQNPIGVGLSMFIDRTGVGSGEYGSVTLRDDGSLLAMSGAMPAGQSHEAVWAGLVARRLGVGPSDVEVVMGDTDLVPRGVGTFASRSLQLGGGALALAASGVAEEIKRNAATMLEADPDDLVLADGHVHVAGVPDAALAFDEIAVWASSQDRTIRCETMYEPEGITFPYGAYAAVVTVDLETGLVEVRDLVAVNDCGLIADLAGTLGQVAGSTAQGLGQALLEWIRYSPDGQLNSTSFMDYVLPAAANTPSARLLMTEHAAPNNAIGAKGIGEAGTIGCPPAVVNATLDALAPYRVADLQMPLHPSRVWEALRAGESIGNLRLSHQNHLSPTTGRE